MMNRIISAFILLGVFFAPQHSYSQESQKPVIIRCENEANGLTKSLRILNEDLWVDGEYVKSSFGDTRIIWGDKNDKDAFFELDRVSGRLTVIDLKMGTIERVYRCQVVEKLMF
jgi:hypothetical protein